MYMQLRRALLFLFLILPLLSVSGSCSQVWRGRLSPRFEDTLQIPADLAAHRHIQRPRIGLVLSGGGARGIAQIGVLRVLEQHHIPIDFIASTSLGAIVGGLYASGYTVAQIESLALHTPWDDVLSLTEENRRTELFVDQKIAGDRSFLAVRFQGFEPVLPAAVSTGQRLTNFLSTQTLQALYHPVPDFDHLKTPFRAVATDLVSGKRVILSSGSLAEALRASATVPLLFAPIERDSMQLVDGGLVANIPVDVARARGVDIVIVVNSTSGLRTAHEMNAPWQTADQIMSIMMKVLNERQLSNADIVITPPVGNHLSSDFRGLDTLIRAGENAAEEQVGKILDLYARKRRTMDDRSDSAVALRHPTYIEFNGAPIPDSLREVIQNSLDQPQLTTELIQEATEDIYADGGVSDVWAEVVADSEKTKITLTSVSNPILNSVHFQGCRLVPQEEIQQQFLPLLGHPVGSHELTRALEGVLGEYRERGYSLARIVSENFDPESGRFQVTMNEGVIDAINVEGTERTQDAFVLNEFPLQPGDVFEVAKARKGISNIAGTTLFAFVYLEISYNPDGHPIVTIRLRERPSQLLRLGMRADNERQFQGLVDIRDENFRGSGMDLGLTVAGGSRNLDATLEYKARRLFNSYLTLGVGGFFKSIDSYLYANAASTEANRWARDRIGEYRESRYGVSLTFGGQLERLGNATVELILQDVRNTSLSNAENLKEHFRLSMVRLGTIVDTKNAYPFPTSGVGLNFSYEFAFQGLGSEIGYNALRLSYEDYATWGGRVTFHPRFTMGFADRTMPFSQQFRLGGRESFYGLREDDSRGRQLLLLNLEWRYFLPVRLLFDTYVRLRYDLGTISSEPEEIKFSGLRHGLGLELAFSTPVGQAAFGAGESFFFSRDLPNNPIQLGPLLWYFAIGYQL
jgi:NTE family protein